MSILNKFTFKDICLNKKRSIVTIIAIILSTALICSIACMFYSFQKVLIDQTIQYDGNYHAIFYDIDNKKAQEINANKQVKETFQFKEIGLVSINSIYNSIDIYEFDKQAFKNLNLTLHEGRLPKNNNELLINKSTISMYDLDYKLGDTITLDYETLTGEKLQKEYKIVGYFDSVSYFSETYTFISRNDNLKENFKLGIVYNNIKDTFKVSNDIGGDYDTNRDLLAYNGVIKNDSTRKTLFTILGIVIGIVIVCSVFVIRNSFAISITEKKKEFGMLSSIGATKKQIKKLVIKEGLFLSVIGIPLGILLGILAAFILVIFTKTYLGNAFGEEIIFSLNIPWIVLIITIICSLITVLLSSLSSARKASKISPIESIRNNDDIKIKAKKIKTNKLVKKIFGIGGVIASKSLKRSKKKYRTTVISLVVSITVFISLSTFVTSMFKIIDNFYINLDYNFVVSDYDENLENRKETLEKIITFDTVEKYNYLKVASIKAENNNFNKLIPKKYNEELEISNNQVTILSFGEQTYKNYLKDLNLNYEKAKDKLIFFTDNDDIKFNSITLNGKTYDVIKITNKPAFAMEYYNVCVIGYFVASDELINDFDDIDFSDIAIYTNDYKLLGEQIKNLDNDEIYYSSIDEEVGQINKIIVWMSVFLYGFIIVISLIGVTNIFNTITTNMSLRSKEFAILRSVGMTDKEFNKMIRLESILYGMKSFIIGSILGTIISYFIQKNAIFSINGNDAKVAFTLPYMPMIISFVFVMAIVTVTMKYSMSKINKQNIIETIRKDNI